MKNKIKIANIIGFGFYLKGYLGIIISLIDNQTLVLNAL